MQSSCGTTLLSNQLEEELPAGICLQRGIRVLDLRQITRAERERKGGKIPKERLNLFLQAVMQQATLPGHERYVVCQISAPLLP